MILFETSFPKQIEKFRCRTSMIIDRSRTNTNVQHKFYLAMVSDNNYCCTPDKKDTERDVLELPHIISDMYTLLIESKTKQVRMYGEVQIVMEFYKHET